MNQSSSDNDSSAGFPWFEERNYPGWLIQFKAHLRKTGSHFVLDNPRPDDLDANGVPQVLTNQQRRALETQQSEYDKADNIAYSELMKALRLNPKTKNLSETGVFNTAFELLTRLRCINWVRRRESSTLIPMSLNARNSFCSRSTNSVPVGIAKMELKCSLFGEMTFAHTHSQHTTTTTTTTTTTQKITHPHSTGF